MSDQPVPRGRGAALREALLRKKAEEEKQVGIQPDACTVEEPPKPKGRAAFLKQLHDSRLRRVGIEISSIETSSIETNTSELTSQKKPIESEMEDVSRSVSHLEISDREPLTFQGKCLYFIYVT